MRHTSRFICVMIATLCCGSAWAEPPRIVGLQPARAPARTLVLISGDRLEKSRIFWDAGLPSEKQLSGSIGGGTMFSVPPDASPGSHPVAVELENEGRSEAFTFVVAGNAPIGTPRIDHVTLVETVFESDGKVQCILYVQGPNIDVGATVLIDGNEHRSEAHKAITNNLFGATHAALGFPIRHYLSRIVPLTSRAPGSVVRVQIRNEAEELSSEYDYTLPRDDASLDSDGDGIPDVVELNGYDNGNGRVDLSALGADPFRKDIFVELDIMQGIAHAPIPSHGNQPGALELVRNMFASAPILNPFGPNGINLFIDMSGSVPFWEFLGFQRQHNTVTRTGSFTELRKDNFTPARRGLFHYAIWGNAHPLGWSGESNVDFDGTKVGDGFIIALSEFPIEYQTLKSQAATFAHELGHNLGQRHGGGNHSPYKPNYWSVMSYTWQLRTGWPNSSRVEKPTCTQIFYATEGATELNGAIPLSPGVVIDYSEGMGPTLIPNNESLNERRGVCGQPIDWDRNGTISDHGVNAIVDPDDPSGGPVTDFANWANLLFNGP